MPLIFITGATGFIGSNVALKCLQSGYSVRIAIRREEQKTQLLRHLSQHTFSIDFAVVPDFTAAGAFDKVLSGVDHILHLASPLSILSENPVTPAVRGTLSILESAMKHTSVKKVVITASVLSFIPLGKPMDRSVVREDDDVDLSVDESEVDSMHPFSQYHASKIASYAATLDFVKNQHPSFSVVTMHPVYVFGKNFLQETVEELSGTNGHLFQSLKKGDPQSNLFTGVHVDDVAKAHVKVLDQIHKGTGVASYLLAAKPRSWREVNDFIRKQYPGVEFGLQPSEGTSFEIITTKAETELDLVFKPMEDQVKDVVDQQLAFQE